VVLDNLCNSHAAVLGRIAQIAGKAPEVVRVDVRNLEALREAFSQHRFDAVIHSPTQGGR